MSNDGVGGLVVTHLQARRPRRRPVQVADPVVNLLDHLLARQVGGHAHQRRQLKDDGAAMWIVAGHDIKLQKTLVNLLSSCSRRPCGDRGGRRRHLMRFFWRPRPYSPRTRGGREGLRGCQPASRTVQSGCL